MKKNPLFYFLVVLLTSCNGVSSPISTPTPNTGSSATTMAVKVSSPVGSAVEVAVSPTVLPLQTNVPATASPMPSPVNSPTIAQVNQQPYAAILARMYPGSFVLLGGTENGKWLSPETVAPQLSDGEMYHIYGVDGPTGSAKGKTPGYDQFCQGYLVETDSYPFGGRAVGVTGNWDVMPRLAQEISTDNATYVEVLKTWLVGQNIPEPVVEIDQILRVDIEGDGTDEILISASHFVEPTGHSVALGDYSLVVMRKVIGNSVVTIPIIADYYYQEVEIQFPLTYAALFVADLNADGTLEILVGVERWEGTGVLVYEVEGTNIQMIFRLICGL